jgi:hypothetical protein
MLLAGWGPCGINVRDALGKWTSSSVIRGWLCPFAWLTEAVIMYMLHLLFRSNLALYE